MPIINSNRRFLAATGAAGAVALAAGALAVALFTGPAAKSVAAQSPLPMAAPSAAQSGTAFTASYSDIVDRVSPAVVTVRVEKRATAREVVIPDSLRDFFRRRVPGGLEPPVERRHGGLGSGVIVRNDGYVLTNHHVITDADRVRVELADKRWFDATVVGSDSASDLAVIKIDATGLPTMPIADSARVKVGDVVLAFGNPLGIGQTVTMGIVSATGRATGVGDGGYEDFIQTDAPINQGNSGGALVNLDGQLVGINTQILSPSGGNIGLGFAIPSTMAQAVADQLIEDGVVRRAMLGVTVQSVNSDLAASLGLTEVRGALVSSVEPGSAAARAGVRQGDVIVELDGNDISDANSLRNQVASQQPGHEASLLVLRDRREQVLKAKLGEREAEPRQARLDTTPDSHDEAALGIAVKPLTASSAEQFGLPENGAGLLVTNVAPNGPAADVGIQEGDVITRVNNQQVSDVDSLRAAMAASPERPALVLLTRDGANLFVALHPRA